MPSKDDESNRNYQYSFQEKRTNIIIKFREFFKEWGKKIPIEARKKFLEETLRTKEREYLNKVKLPEETKS
jgi:hypothetical protein